MHDFTPVLSLLGGTLIGLASGLLLLSSGQIAGISGIVGGVLSRPTRAGAWRWSFLAGMLLAAIASHALWPARFDLTGLPSLAWVALAGLCVGVGSALGSGCTSGHGVCGIARWSRRSLVATFTFMLTGALTVFLLNRWTGATL